MWISIGLLWIISPVVELVIIIGLLSERSRDKRQIQALKEGKGTEIAQVRRDAREMGYGCWPVEKAAGAGMRTAADEVRQVSGYGALAGKKAEREKKEKRIRANKNGLGTLALILGIIFVVLAGVIFATTTWRIMADGLKVLLVFGCSVLFFGTSLLVERQFKLQKTGNAFYVLGSIFLFLSVLAAAYFELLGSTFVLMGVNRWKVLWVGSLVLEAAFLAGIKRFNERLYTQASLWGMSVSMLFMAKALQVGWRDFFFLMTLYSFGLAAVSLWIGGENRENEKEKDKDSGFWGLLTGEMPVFGRLHFWVFSLCTMEAGLFTLNGVYSPSVLGAAALAAVILGMRGLRQERGKGVYPVFYALSAAEAGLYAARLWGSGRIPGEGILLSCLCLMALWDIWKKDGLEFPILFLGVGEQIYLYLEKGTGAWWVSYTVLLALYLFRYRSHGQWRKPALSASSVLLAIAFWGQSITVWPEWIALECSLLPFALLLVAMGEIWKEHGWIKAVQRGGHMLCLGILAWDAWSGGLVADALITEACCLAAFIWGQVKKDVWWVRVSGGLMLVIALFMTKDFWMSISWWIYLFAAGLGLILFAAVSEKKRQAEK